jgi:hypothetical protein
MTIGGAGVSDGVGLSQRVEVASGREVAGGGVSVAVRGAGVRISSVGVAGCWGNSVAGWATMTLGCSTVGETADKASGSSMEGTGVVSTAWAQASTRIPHATDSQYPALTMLSLALQPTQQKPLDVLAGLSYYSTLRKGRTYRAELKQGMSLTGEGIGTVAVRPARFYH